MTATTKVFFVPGIPVAKGSTRAFYHAKANRVVTVQTNRDKQKPWASLIAVLAMNNDVKPVAGPVFVSMSFTFPRPKKHYRGKSEVLRDDAPVFHATKPDVDKLVRCVFDALTGIAWLDDSQAQIVEAIKMYCDGETNYDYAEPGCLIELSYEYPKERTTA